MNNRVTIPNLKIKTIHETIDYIIEHNSSVARFGEGEVCIMEGGGIYYQQYDKQLANGLTKILQLPSNEKFVVCLPGTLQSCEQYNDYCNQFWNGHILAYQNFYHSMINKEYWYGDALISRPYMDFADKSECSSYFKHLKQIWAGKDILIVEGKTSRSGVGNDLFQSAKSIKRIICPANNAFYKLDEIRDTILKLADNRLILLMLGPTAKVLAYQLSNSGYQAIDIGHIDSEYEWFKVQADHKIRLGNHKHTAEWLDQEIHAIEDPEYNEQIIADISAQPTLRKIFKSHD